MKNSMFTAKSDSEIAICGWGVCVLQCPNPISWSSAFQPTILLHLFTNLSGPISFKDFVHVTWLFTFSSTPSCFRLSLISTFPTLSTMLFSAICHNTLISVAWIADSFCLLVPILHFHTSMLATQWQCIYTPSNFRWQMMVEPYNCLKWVLLCLLRLVCKMLQPID